MSDMNSNQSFDDNERRPFRGDASSNWVAGVVLVLIGLIFLSQNLFGFGLNNWWALFILIPAASQLTKAYQMYRSEGRLSAQGRGALLGGAFLCFLAFAFLFGINFGLVWPVLLIAAGLIILINGRLPD